MLYSPYEYLIFRGLEERTKTAGNNPDTRWFPREICFMLSETDLKRDPGKLEDVCSWCMLFPEIERIIFHISSLQPDTMTAYIPRLREIGRKTSLQLSTPEKDTRCGSGKPEVLIVLGKSGREEITDAIVQIAHGDYDPETITEETIESHLKYKVNPDFVIKTGGSHLTDFLIWQSVYSELFFTDVNWSRFRRIDFFRALRDYQSRVRKYGK